MDFKAALFASLPRRTQSCAFAERALTIVALPLHAQTTFSLLNVYRRSSGHPT
mgnify:CR=1